MTNTESPVRRHIGVFGRIAKVVELSNASDQVYGEPASANVDNVLDERVVVLAFMPCMTSQSGPWASEKTMSVKGAPTTIALFAREPATTLGY